MRILFATQFDKSDTSYLQITLYFEKYFFYITKEFYN